MLFEEVFKSCFRQLHRFRVADRPNGGGPGITCQHVYSANRLASCHFTHDLLTLSGPRGIHAEATAQHSIETITRFSPMIKGLPAWDIVPLELGSEITKGALIQSLEYGDGRKPGQSISG